MLRVLQSTRIASLSGRASLEASLAAGKDKFDQEGSQKPFMNFSPPAVPFTRVAGEGSPTKIDHRKRISLF